MTFKARDVMSKDLISVRPSTPFRAIVSTLHEHAISGVPVLTAQGTLVGIITESDLMLKEEGRPGFRTHPLTFAFEHSSEELSRKADGSVARDVMTSPVLTADEDTELREVARMMALNHIKRVIVTRNDEAVGIVTRADVLKVFLRPDEEIRTELIETLLPTDFGAVNVEVRNGIVTMNGSVLRRTLAEFLGRYAQRVEGVVRVRNHLVYDTEE